jgi:SAM-dependent methyltransferase
MGALGDDDEDQNEEGAIVSDPTSFWNARYAESGFAYGDQPNDFLREVANRITTGPVLCLAEGEGRNAVYLATRGHDVTAVDLSATGLAKAEALARSRGVSIRTAVADLDTYVIQPGAWAAIVSIWAHVPESLRARIHHASVAGLRPHGVFVLEAYTPAQLALGTGGPKDVSLLVDPDALRTELAGLDLVRFETITREVHEGPYHDGQSAVVRVLGVRR